MGDALVSWLPAWLRVGLGFCAMVALPFVVWWMIRGTAETVKGVTDGLLGGPMQSCLQLGLTPRERGAVSGEAVGAHASLPVRVHWAVGHGHGFHTDNHRTTVAASIATPLGLALSAAEGEPGRPLGLGELDERLGVQSQDVARTTAVLRMAWQPLWAALHAPGQLRITDTEVSIVLPGVDPSVSELQHALDHVCALAHALAASARASPPSSGLADMVT